MKEYEIALDEYIKLKIKYETCTVYGEMNRIQYEMNQAKDKMLVALLLLIKK